MKNVIKPQTLKGFRDFLPGDAIARNYVIGKIRQVFEKFGFDPLETPALEYAEVLLGKYGEEADKLLYLFEDRGKRKVGLRYDQTVPLARIIAQYQNIAKPFKRYQIQPVWRAENPQAGRYREFLQCDIDIVGTGSALSDAEIILCTLAVYEQLGFKSVQMRVNDRSIFDSAGLTKTMIITLDKLEKIGKEAVLSELRGKNIKDPDKIFAAIKSSPKTKRLREIFSILTANGLKEGKDFVFDRFLARGLEYYTSVIFEVKSGDYNSGSLAGGGRYDNLINQFIGINVPATGIAFGFDRTLEALTQNKLLPTNNSVVKILVTIFSPELLEVSTKATSFLRDNNINTELYLDADTKLDKQLKYADKRGIPYVLIIGPEEAKKNLVKLKDMKTGEQKEFTIEKIIQILTTS